MLKKFLETFKERRKLFSPKHYSSYHLCFQPLTGYLRYEYKERIPKKVFSSVMGDVLLFKDGGQVFVSRINQPYYTYFTNERTNFFEVELYVPDGNPSLFWNEVFPVVLCKMEEELEQRKKSIKIAVRNIKLLSRCKDNDYTNLLNMNGPIDTLVEKKNKPKTKPMPKKKPSQELQELVKPSRPSIRKLAEGGNGRIF